MDMNSSDIHYYQGNSSQEYYHPAGSKRSREDADFPNDDYSELQENTEYSSQDGSRYTKENVQDVIEEDQLDVCCLMFFFFISQS